MGSNLGNRRENLKQAIFCLQQIGIKIKAISNIYETSPWGFTTPFSFYNLIALVETSLSPFALLFEIKKIEATLGKIPKVTKRDYQDRFIDIDLIFYEDLNLETNVLTLPHPLAHLRDFVMVPVVELVPDWVHPVLRKSLKDIFEEKRNLFVKNVKKIGVLQ
ncbi:2-amino-4-hydroxy-6-hydroxymethyldihydropteridine diphosphokinase [Thermodesulfobacterium commune]|uniref:2-amino-4-hydroxy-6- hydroxymethyldihydropteridine diphosphokinase n=1 Tax=Thermodesulfobacterium commune TaxID=1741 RepID=UPI00068F8BAD|nr:2-amino-4-hydroxy-6-hydroxymethyldihydropteridine diphosphokinase [Thermodesulfobacterium commune]HBT04562.1 2-amino-4-hydroxy-6-hydroxymethyldihydropteridine diphosphokinase [Thermodesulfobacterium commune]